jgi:hypothetical protein
MAISADFTVNGNANQDRHFVDDGDTVTLTINSSAGVRTEFSIIGASRGGVTYPTLTESGSPPGSTATFTMSENDTTLGISFLVQCVATSQYEIATQYAVVGVANATGHLPIAMGESGATRDATGYIEELNSSLAGNVPDNVIARWQAVAGSATPDTLGFGNTASGTATARTPATTIFATSLSRIGYVSAASTGVSSGTRYGVGVSWFGNSASRGGFDYEAVFYTPLIFSTSRIFVGLYGGTTEIANVDPSTLTNIVAFAADDTDTNWQLMTNNGSGSASKTDLGASFPKVDITSVYKVRIWCEPNSTSVSATLTNINTGATETIGTTGDLPSSTTFLSTHIWINTAAGSAAVAVDVMRQRLTTDY